MGPCSPPSAICMSLPEPRSPAAPIIAGLLRLIACGAEPIEVLHWDTSSAVATASGWWLVLATRGQGDELEEVEGLLLARPPSAMVPSWTIGGWRDCWTAGPGAFVRTPWDLLTAEQQESLQRRLRDAPRMALLQATDAWDTSNLWLEDLPAD